LFTEKEPENVIAKRKGEKAVAFELIEVDQPWAKKGEGEMKIELNVILRCDCDEEWHLDERQKVRSCL
jgi:hypothetical protein